MTIDGLKLAEKVVLLAMMAAASLPLRAAEDPTVSFEELIRESTVPRNMLDEWLRVPSWVTFDPELGYVLGNSVMPWGIDDSATIETIQPNGARTTIMYAAKKPRINAYGDSFTESQQVN